MNIMCWGEHSQNNHKDITAEFHFNYWPQVGSKDTEKKAYLDIGVKLINCDDLTSLIFWFPKEFVGPFEIEHNFMDLGERIKDNKTASLVFNEVLKTSSDTGKPKQTEVLDSQGKKLFVIYELSKENIKISQEYGGMTMYIPLEQLINQKLDAPIYIRFRLSGDFIKSIERKIIVKNRLLQSAFTETSYIDFRFNDVRSCNNDLQEYLISKGKIKIEKMHFLLMAYSDEEVTDAEFDTARILEAEAWKHYLGEKIDHVCVAYHWRFDPQNHKDNIVYARYKVLRCNGGTITLYIIILFLLTVIMNLASSTIYGHLHTLIPAIFP